MNIDELTEIVIGCAYQVHKELGEGFLEKVYENALCIELNSSGIKAKQQYPIMVYYRKQVVGDFIADIFIEDRLIVELKAVRNLSREHEVQLVNYLAATGIEDGLLINFGASVAVKRKFRTYKKLNR